MKLRAFIIKALILNCSSLALANASSRALFTEGELQELEVYKQDQTVYARQIEDWRKDNKRFFPTVLSNTSIEDLARLKKELPKVLELMDKADEAAWLKQTLIELSK